jgi:RNA polymerase sigma-70 factor (ECF subfamily)
VDEIAHRYGRLVSSVCWRMTRDETLARDAAQEVWLEILRSLPSFAGRAKLSTWIWQIAWRVTRRYLVRERRYSVRFLKQYCGDGEIDVPDERARAESAQRAWVEEMCDKCLSGVLQCLEPEQRLAYLLRDLVELDYAEIATVLEAHEPAVRQWISRARRKLHSFLTDRCVLANPKGTCRCRMTRHVLDADLPAEYERLCGVIRRAQVYKQSEQVLPAKDYWLGLLGK